MFHSILNTSTYSVYETKGRVGVTTTACSYFNPSHGWCKSSSAKRLLTHIRIIDFCSCLILSNKRWVGGGNHRRSEKNEFRKINSRRTYLYTQYRYTCLSIVLKTCVSSSTSVTKHTCMVTFILGKGKNVSVRL